MAHPRPQPTALPLDAPHPLPPLSSAPSPFLPVLACPASFSLAHFTAGLSDIVHQPEHSSSTILRADIHADDEHPHPDSDELPARWGRDEGWVCTRRVRRRILPSRPQFDGAMEQECLFYQRRVPSTGSTPPPGGGEEEEDDDDQVESAVLLLPDFEQLKTEPVPDTRGKGRPRDPAALPYYHPQVYALAFRYLPASLSSLSPPSPSLRIDLVPLPPSSSPAPPLEGPLVPLKPTDRLYRTALALIQFADKVCQGKKDGYNKRVNHDLLVGKSEVQDLYQKLKAKYHANILLSDPRLTFPRHLAQSWAEGTDPEKHVFEDVAIAAWLICLWRGMYGDVGGVPPGGFVDVGCGNGLLVYLLHSEGIPGFGLDLRARKSWDVYPSSASSGGPPTPPDLRVTSLNPVDLLLSSPYLSFASSSPAVPSAAAAAATDANSWPFPPSSFLLGNHADELTPWLPLFAAATPGERVGFLNIPCCLHELVGRFERQTYAVPGEFLETLPVPPPPLPPSGSGSPSPPPLLSPASAPAPPAHPLLTPFYAPAPSQLSSSEKSRYVAYQLYLAHLTLLCGFVPEREALRIPSTKNFGMVGRRRTWEGVGERVGKGGEREGAEEREKEKTRERVRELVEEVRAKGEWRARKPEGKAGGH
ncbi:hypothetical protein JCM6882_008355 [Rhodosporidiobolus microsporus]